MRSSGYTRAKNDWYVEPASCVDALLDVEKFDGVTLDPCCGGGNIPARFRARGLECMGSDIVDRGAGFREANFFHTRPLVTNIVSNPPYGVIERFINHALECVHRKVVVLARLALLEGQARREKFDSWPLARVWVSSRRLSMPPGGEDIKASGGTIAYAWFVFEQGFVDPATIGWV